ncbi:tyrosine-type recombinase/integrase [Sulfurovum mangrovi]|uniref:tyrosine-type recombinase/integrase n=1 Tax=Sulfurovum mangrovi TaxID=2893889 RepID=UPI001E41D874|nr:site-specific integrase [Sulfurovum mangrovi]UFH59807.1 site-specific integrase [Sulfurovum mangrovi]UFH59858.1 site-specific integrase [Sulfurovum mangrovi]UFH60604.1 site-specific integrase [Sulfurovum mangrovi]
MSDMVATRYEGLYYRKNKRNKKVFYARFKIAKKPYLRKLGEEPVMNTTMANEARLKMIADIRGGADVIDEKIFDEYFEEYLENWRATYSESWWYNTKLAYNKHLKDIIGKSKPSEMQPFEIQKVLNDLLLGNNDKIKKYKPSTIKHMKNAITGTFDHIIKQGINIRNIGRDLTIPSYDNKVYFSISDVQAKKLFDVILNYDDPKWRAYFVWLLHGRRKMEVAEARWEWLHLHDMEYVIPGKYTKSGKDIIAPITNLLKDALERYGIREEGFVFVGNGQTGHISSTGIDFQWRNIRALAGVPKMRLHDIRHLIGYIGVNSGYSLEQIGAVLSHGSTETTKRYSNMKRDTARDVLGNMFDMYVK